MKLTVETKGIGVAMTPLLLTADGVGAAAAFLMMLFVGGCLIGVSFYLLPSFIVGEGDQTVSVLLVNLFFGWAVFGWLGCLIWAISYLVGRQGNELTPWVERRAFPFLTPRRRESNREKSPPGVN
jgi:hypothetical protein